MALLCSSKRLLCLPIFANGIGGRGRVKGPPVRRRRRKSVCVTGAVQGANWQPFGDTVFFFALHDPAVVQLGQI